MAEVKPVQDIFKKPRAEPESSSQKLLLPIVFSIPAILRSCQSFCLQHVESAAVTRKKNARDKELQKKRTDCTGQFLFILHWGLQGCRDPQAELGWGGDVHSLHLLDFPCEAFPPLCHSGPPSAAPAPRPIRTQGLSEA